MGSTRAEYAWLMANADLPLPLMYVGWQGLLAEVRAYRRADLDDDAFAAILLRRVTTHLYHNYNNQH